MDRKHFLKTCAGGLCACATVGGLTPVLATAAPAAADWRLPFVKQRYAKLLGILSDKVDEPTLNDILRLLGRHCASTYSLTEKHRGDVDGFIQEFQQQTKEEISYDREMGLITIVGPERDDCFCPLVDRRTISGQVCNCSLGWQEYTYETLLERRVEVTLKESVVRGGKRCVFEIRMLNQSLPHKDAAAEVKSDT
jgi:predicted hydrocarbon binding protein